MDKWLIKKSKSSGALNDDGTSIATGETSAIVETKESKHSHGRKRNYNETYLQYGFTFSEINSEQRPMCVICSEHLANEKHEASKIEETSRHVSSFLCYQTSEVFRKVVTVYKKATV